MSLMNTFHLINNFLAAQRFLFVPCSIQSFTAQLQKHSYSFLGTTVQCQLKTVSSSLSNVERRKNESEPNIIDYREPLKITVPRGLLGSLENLMDYYAHMFSVEQQKLINFDVVNILLLLYNINFY